MLEQVKLDGPILHRFLHIDVAKDLLVKFLVFKVFGKLLFSRVLSGQRQLSSNEPIGEKKILKAWSTCLFLSVFSDRACSGSVNY